MPHHAGPFTGFPQRQFSGLDCQSGVTCYHKFNASIISNSILFSSLSLSHTHTQRASKRETDRERETERERSKNTKKQQASTKIYFHSNITTNKTAAQLIMCFFFFFFSFSFNAINIFKSLLHLKKKKKKAPPLFSHMNIHAPKSKAENNVLVVCSDIQWPTQSME